MFVTILLTVKNTLCIDEDPALIITICVDTNIPEVVNSSEVLQIDGIRQERAATVAALLRDEYNLSLSEEDIINLSVQE